MSYSNTRALDSVAPSSVSASGWAASSPAPLGLLPSESPAGLLLAWLAALDQVGVAMLLMHPDGRVLHANRQAKQHCQDSPVMCLVGHQLRLLHPVDVSQFDRALAQAGTGRRSLLLLGGGTRPVAVALQPTASGSGTTLVLVLVSGQEPANALSLRLFADLHRLTKAEHKVLRELALGLSPKEVADTAGVALTTVRSQIQAIRDKTSARTLRELLQRVACLPPMLPPDLGRQRMQPVVGLTAAAE